MCGVLGYVGYREALPLILTGLKRMEYRGYDSAGIAIHNGEKIEIIKEKGKLNNLEPLLKENPLKGTTGIGHTRWATHGEPNQINAHPHSGNHSNIILIHNGIIENYHEIREFLLKKGNKFTSETDTEVLAHLIEYFYDNHKNLEQAVREALSQVIGAYGIAVLDKNEPKLIVVARKGSPLVIGIGENENFIASDVAAIIDSTRNVIYLNDGEMAIVTDKSVDVKTITNIKITAEVKQVTFDIEAIEKGGYDHFMLKEIFEQPKTVEEAMRGRLIESEGRAHLGGLADVVDKIVNANRIIISACGTSWHAALIGEYILEEFCRIPVEVEYASEFRYRDPVVQENDVLFVVSQSGETADTLAAMREAQNKGALCLGICNVVGSTIARETTAGVYIHAGPEIGVASTKAFTAQVTVFSLIALMIARKKNMSSSHGIEFVKALKKLPSQIDEILKQSDKIKTIAAKFKNLNNALYLGRGYNFPVALEGALKLKEISYIHAEGYPAAEMKHGPIALIDENMPVICIATQDAIYDKVISNIEEVKARKGNIISIATVGDTRIKNISNEVIYIPNTLPQLVPILANIPLQLLSYYVALERGCNVDQPRNLAKSVTVE
jgi:glutamine---fructose-6-phosphate transaminase (isomerizing)